MGEPFAVEIPSDDEDDISPFHFPFPSNNDNDNNKKKGVEKQEAPLLIIDDDFTPKKPNLSPTPSLVPDTPFSIPSEGDSSIVKCSIAACSDRRSRPTPESFSGISGLICLESDNECEGGSLHGSPKERETTSKHFGMAQSSKTSFSESARSFGKGSESNYIGLCSPSGVVLEGTDNEESGPLTENLEFFYDRGGMKDNISHFEFAPSDVVAVSDYSLPGNANVIQIVGDSPIRDGHEDAISQIPSDHDKENAMLEQVGGSLKRKTKSKSCNVEKKRHKDEEMARKEKLKEERKLKREQEKLRKEAMKAEVAAMKKLQKEKEKWEKGKFALKFIVAEIDKRVVEVGSIGGHLLTRFAEKGLTFRVTSNPIEKSILWKLDVPDQISELTSKGSEVPYVLLVYEADEFCNLVINDILKDHVSIVQNYYPTYTICFLTNKLMAYINKREQAQYKNPSNSWRRPPVDEVLAKLAVDFVKVHSRQCRDESELAEHVVGLTNSLATCQFRKQLTRLSVNANGSLIPKDFIDKNLIKKSVWLKALVAIPKVQPRFAVAIWKKYPTMRSLLNAYMDPSKSVHEKEFLLKDLRTDGLLGQEERRVGEICSKRVYRILMARSGNIKTDEVEDGADFF
ncbi:hypothetical protein MRB53_012067 [Persea americana]|uniref:Uncharacterized protein n=1 Tax=Persea americana TaxID=3435 RepID=A0ACC2LWL0_PERAE|nr:hypothetical protein MRB53_012067 [Persea americana]